MFTCLHPTNLTMHTFHLTSHIIRYINHFIMASIAKLSIRGVRAFSPNDDEQVIGFCFPLTIIVGANGCGTYSLYYEG